MINKMETIFRMEGKVVRNLSNGFYQIILTNNQNITACVSGKMRKYSIRILVNDLVDIDMSIYDLTKGRIVARK